MTSRDYTFVEHLFVPGVRILLLAAALFFAAGGWLYYDSLPQPLCTFNQEEYQLNYQNHDAENEILFTLTNPSREVVKIVGLADC